jgi:hypothetical protein
MAYNPESVNGAGNGAAGGDDKRPNGTGAPLPPDDQPTYRFARTAPPAALEPFRNEPRWVGWMYLDKDGTWAKVPINPKTGKAAKVSEPATWGTFDQALAWLKRGPRVRGGIGIVFYEGGGLWGGDLDDCFTDSDSLSPLAAEMISCAESYAERSPSSTGLKFFCKGDIPDSWKNEGRGVELYGRGRFFTVTGWWIEDTPAEVRAAPTTLARFRAEAPAKRAKPNGSAKPNGAASSGGDFFANVNTTALARLESWVPRLHPSARYQPGTGRGGLRPPIWAAACRRIWPITPTASASLGRRQDSQPLTP